MVTIMLNNFFDIRNVAASGTYTSDCSNPSKFLLNPGTNNVKIVTFGAYKGKAESITIEVKKVKPLPKLNIAKIFNC